MGNIQYSHVQSLSKITEVCNNQDQIQPDFLSCVDLIPTNKQIHIPNGYIETYNTSTNPKQKQKVYKRTYKSKNDFKLQSNKFLLYCYRNNYNDPVHKSKTLNLRHIKISNTNLYTENDIFGFKITNETCYLSRLHSFYINFCFLLSEQNEYKDKTKGRLTNVFKCIRFDLRYLKTFTTISPVHHRDKQKQKYKTHYTKKFTTKYIVHFNKLLMHWLHHNFDKYMYMYNTEFRQKHTGDTSLYTANNPHHHCYVYFNQRYSLKDFFDTINTFWCLALNIPLPLNKKTGLIDQCPPRKFKLNNPHFKYTNGNGLVIDDTKESYMKNICSVFMRSTYLCKYITDNKNVNLGKQFNIMTDDTTKKYLQLYPQYILPPYYTP